MGERSNISWTRSTFNPWIGCTKIGPGCDHCYAEVQDSRKRWGGVAHWGDGIPRYRTSLSTWRNVYKWDNWAALERERGEVHDKHDWPTPGFWPVFCASLADIFDNQVPQEWRDDLWKVVEGCSNLSWLIVTKRIGNVAKMVPSKWHERGFPKHVRILITVVNQEEADRDLPKLLRLKCRNGVSYEPALGPIDWERGGWSFLRPLRPPPGNKNGWERGIEWLIIGGESDQPGHKARAFDLEWARSTIQQCKAAGVSVFFKQAGSYPILDRARLQLRDRAGSDLTELPTEFQIQEFPSA